MKRFARNKEDGFFASLKIFASFDIAQTSLSLLSLITKIRMSFVLVMVKYWVNFGKYSQMNTILNKNTCNYHKIILSLHNKTTMLVDN